MTFAAGPLGPVAAVELNDETRERRGAHACRVLDLSLFGIKLAGNGR